MTSWKSDLNTSLAALELLSGLARIPIPEQGINHQFVMRILCGGLVLIKCTLLNISTLNCHMALHNCCTFQLGV